MKNIIFYDKFSFKNKILMRKSTLVSILFISFSFACTKNTLPLQYSNKDETSITLGEFLSDAVYNGLISNKVPSETVKTILTNSNNLFVGKCPICKYTEKAFRKYMQNNPIVKQSEISASILEGFESSSKLVQQKSLRDLMNIFIQQHYNNLKMSDRGKERMKHLLMKGRKEGMGAKRDSFGKFCPSCDGACKIKE